MSFLRTGGGFKRDKDAPAKQRDSGKTGGKKFEQKGQAPKKNISVAKLREEAKNKGKHEADRKGKRFGRFRKGKHGGRPGKKGSKTKDPAELDKEMETYWMKGGDTSLVKKRLDDDLEDYFKKTEEDGAAVEAPAIKADEPSKE